MKTLSQIRKREKQLEELMNQLKKDFGYPTDPGYIQLNELRKEMIHLIGLRQSGQFTKED